MSRLSVAIHDEQIRQVSAYGDLSVAMSNLMNGVDNQLFTGWMKGFADGGDDLVRKTKIITEAAGMLGEGVIPPFLTGQISRIR